jgi:hypothetical protein
MLVRRHTAPIPGGAGYTHVSGRRRRALLTAARAAHDLGLAAWFGGAAMGAVGLNAATREVDEPTQRNRVANAAWFRWAPMTAIAIGAHLGGVWIDARVGNGASLVGAGDAVTVARTVATGVALAATAESGRSGRQVVKGGDVPVATAVEPISDTPDHVAAAMRRLRVVQWTMPAATGGILVCNAIQRARES